MSGDHLARPEPIALLRELEAAGAVTAVSLAVPPDIPWARFEALAAYFGALGSAVYWWIGDLLVAGEAIFGEECAQVDEVLGRSPETLRRWRWVCERIAPSRRRPHLSFRHHQHVASFPQRSRSAGLTA